MSEDGFLVSVRSKVTCVIYSRPKETMRLRPPARKYIFGVNYGDLLIYEFFAKLWLIGEVGINLYIDNFMLLLVELYL